MFIRFIYVYTEKYYRMHLRAIQCLKATKQFCEI